MNDDRYKKQLKTKMLEDLFLFFKVYDVQYCVIGDSSRLPYEIKGDIDFVVSASQLLKVSSLMRQFEKEYNYRLIQVLRHEQSAYYFVFQGANEENEIHFICPDICSDYYKNGRKLLSAGDILEGRVFNVFEKKSNRGFFVAAPEKEFIYYLLKKIKKNSITQTQINHLKIMYMQAPEKSFLWLELHWDKLVSSVIVEAVINEDILSLQGLFTSLSKKMKVRYELSMKARWAELVRIVGRVLQPTGVVIALLGPDGAGKTAVGEGLQKQLLPAFRARKHFHLRPHVLGMNSAKQGVPVTDPHAKPSRGIFPSLVKLVYFWLDYTVGYWLRIRPLLVRSNLVLFDRYYHDLLVDPKRYRYSAPIGLARFVGGGLPKPDLFIVLDASAETIHARKQEVSLEETQRQRAAYLKFATETKNAIVLNTDQSLEATVNEATLAVLQYMQKRQSARMGLNDAN